MCTPTLDIWTIKDSDNEALWHFLAAVEALQAGTFTEPLTAPALQQISVTVTEIIADDEQVQVTANVTLPDEWTFSPPVVWLIKTGQPPGGQAQPEVRLIEISPTIEVVAGHEIYAIEGELYQSVDSWKWRPWWMCDCWLNQVNQVNQIAAQANFFGLSTPYNGQYKLGTANQKTRVALRDFVLANQGEGNLNCPWTGAPLLHRRDSSSIQFEFTHTWTERSETKRTIYVHEPPSIDHLIPSAIVLKEDTSLATGNNLMAVSPRANMLKADWYPDDIQAWLSRKNYSEACSKHVLTRTNEKQDEDSFTNLYANIFGKLAPGPN